METVKIYGLNKKLVGPPRNGKVIVTLPIGPDDDKWGRFEVDEKDVELQSQEKQTKNILLTKENYDLTFQNGTRSFAASDLMDKYYDSIDWYAIRQKEKLILRDLDSSDCISRGDYYIVNVRVLPEVAPSEVISTTVRNEFVYFDNYGRADVKLGAVDYDRNIKFRDENDHAVYSKMKCSEIKAAHEKWKEHQRELDQMEEEERY